MIQTKNTIGGRVEEENRSVALRACPECGEVPHIEYACGEYFIVPKTKEIGECFCGNFNEMHSSEDREISVWNQAVIREELSEKG